MLYLAYSSLYPDGAGAQLQRILGIYALSRFLGCGYIHVRVKNIKYQGPLRILAMRSSTSTSQR